MGDIGLIPRISGVSGSGSSGGGKSGGGTTNTVANNKPTQPVANVANPAMFMPGAINKPMPPPVPRPPQNSYQNMGLVNQNMQNSGPGASPAVLNSQNQSFSMIPPVVPIRPSSVTQPSVIQNDEFDMLNLNRMLRM